MVSVIPTTISTLPSVAVADPDPLPLLASLGGTAEDLRLLDAARTEFISHGFRRTSIGDIARRAGVSRPTLYRRIGDKDDIVRRVVLREVAGFFGEHVAQHWSAESARERMIGMFATGVSELRHNELARAVLEFDPEVLTRLVSDDSGSVTAVRDTMALGISGGEPPTTRQKQAAELILRLTVSLIVQPVGLFPLDNEGQARDFATDWLAPLLDAAESGD